MKARQSPYPRHRFQFALKGESRAQFLKRTSFYRPSMRRFVEVTQRPSVLCASHGEFLEQLNVRIAQTGFPRDLFSYRFGRSETNWASFTKNQIHAGYSDDFVQSVAAFFNIRYVQMPFSGPILHDVEDIIDDLVIRCVTSGIDLESEEFENYAGIDFKSLVRDLRQNGVTAWNFGILYHRFRMRVSLPVAYQPFSQSRFDEFYRLVGQVMKTYELTYADVAAMAGRTEGTVVHTLDSYSWNGDVVKDVAKALGLPILQPKDFDPDQRFFMNAELWQEILRRLEELGWTQADLARDLYPKAKDPHLKIMKAALQRTGANQNVEIINENMIRKMCDRLRIKLHTRHTIPKIYYAWEAGVSLRAYTKELGLLIQGSRISLREGHRRVIEDLRTYYPAVRCSASRFKMIEAGTQSQRLFYATSCLLSYYGIKAQLTPGPSDFAVIDLTQSTNLKPHTKTMKTRFAETLFGLDYLAKVTGFDKEQIKHVLGGNKSIKSEVSYRVLRLLNIELKDDEHFKEFKLMEAWCESHHYSMIDICEQAGLTVDEYYQLKSGLLSFQSDTGRRIKAAYLQFRDDQATTRLGELLLP